MRTTSLKVYASTLALTAAFALSGQALAQEAADEGTDTLDEIVVTASGGDKSQLDSALSVTSVSQDLIQNFKPASESEIYRLIPGIQAAGTAGPGGNSNIAVRGLPVATGGSPFVQLQEDVLFGDIQFGNNDYWTRFDASVERLESVRGGGATTFTSQAPGAVINYISNDGSKRGGFVGVSKGIDFNDTRLDFRYGAPIGESTRFHVGGLYHTGHGPLNNFKVSDSIQIKANVTQDIGEKGYIRILAKFADTQEPNYTGAPGIAERRGTKISDIKPFPGFDGRTDSNYSSLNRTGLFLNRAGTALERQPIDGISTKQFSIGAQLHYEVSDMIKIDNNMRWSDLSGSFASPFLNLARRTSVLGSAVTPGGPVATSIRYASGPRAGQEYTGTYVDNNVNVRTNIRDLGSFANNLALAAKFGSDAIKATARAGLFYFKQDIAMDWHVNKSLREVSGNNPSQLDLYSAPGAAGVKLTQEGISGYNNNWGSCCARDYDLSYTNTAPYLSIDIDADRFAIDGSIRFERMKAKGGGTQGGAEFIVNSGGVNIPAIRSNSAPEIVNYKRNYKSWTAGALFKANDDTSIFGRASRGGRFNGDRQTFGGKFHSTGSTIGALCTSAQTELRNAAGVVTRAAQFGCGADGVTPSVDFVNQYEVGVKNQGDLGGARYSMALSLLKGNFKQSTFELSANRCGGVAGGCVKDAKYKSSGAEFFGTLEAGGFNFVANATYSNAKQKGADDPAYRRASYLPDLTYTLSANYDINDMFGLGLAATGQSGVRDDPGNEYPGGLIVNGNIAVRPIKNIELGLQVYNMFNKLDFRGNGSNVVEPTVSGTVVTGTPVIGRTLTGSLRFKF
jgi:outer membrane receptor protein involved in Fe transport